MRHTRALLVWVCIALAGLASAEIAQAAPPTPLAARLATALTQVSAHGAAAARLREMLGAMARELEAVEHELAAAAARRHVLEAALHRAQTLQAALAREGDAARAHAVAAVSVWRRMTASVLSDRRAPPSEAWLRRSGALLAAVQGELAQAHAQLEAALEGWRQALQLAAWNRLALHALPKRATELMRLRDQKMIAQARLIAERTARLRRQEAALQLARRWQDLERAAQQAAQVAWSEPLFRIAPPQLAALDVRRLERAVVSSWTARTAPDFGTKALAPALLIQTTAVIGGRPLSLPVGGELAYAYGDRRAGPLWRGVTVVTRHAGTVRAPRRGRVAFASPFGNFGPLLILDHGGGYHTLIAGMDRIDVTVGMEVNEGQAVGRLVASPERPRRLYIELRHHGEPVDPLPWLASRLSAEAGSG